MENIEHDPAVDEDWRRLADYMSSAMYEVADELGGDEFVATVTAAAGSASIWPNPDALQLMQDRYPGSAERVMTRMELLAAQARQEEWATLRREVVRGAGRAVLRGFVQLGVGMARLGESMSHISSWAHRQPNGDD